MKLFLTLLAMVSSYSLFCVEKWFISCVILIFVIVVVSLKYRCNRCFLIFLIILCSVSILFSLLPISTLQNDGVFTGVVIEKKNSYVILFDGLEKIYLKIKDENVDLFDLIQVNGELAEFLPYKKPLESGFNFANFLDDKGVYREITAKSYTTLINNPLNIVQIKNTILSQFPAIHEQVIIKALLFGESSYDNEVYVSLKSAGLLILMNFSGLLVNTLFYNLNRLFSLKLKEKASNTISLIIISPLLALNINSPSIIRVFIYRILCYFYMLKDRKINYLKLKCVPFLVLILLDRHLVNSLSIQVPMVITFGLYFANTIINSKKKFMRKMHFYFVLFLLFIPFNLYFNQSINVANNIVNIVFIPINSFLIALLLPSVFMIKIPIISGLLYIDYKILDAINLKYLNINAPPFNQYLLVAYYVLIFVLLFFLEARNKFIYKKIGLVLIAFQCLYFLPLNNYLYFNIHFINVGQGDSTLLTYNGKNILVDTGGSLKEDIATNNLIPYLRKNKIYKIDYLIITHYDIDHYYASTSLKNNFIVDKVYDYTNFYELRIGDLFIYNINTDINNVVEENDKSIVLHCSTSSISLLLMGDASKSVENKIMRKFPDLKATYLKCGHHGSNTSTSNEFVSWLRPKEAIISCGENNQYGHPHKEVIDALKKENVIIRRTDQEGTITYRFFRQL